MTLSSSILLLSILATATPEAASQGSAQDLHQSVKVLLEQMPALQKPDFIKSLRLTVSVQSRLPAAFGSSKRIKKNILGTAYGVLDSLGVRPLGQTNALDDQAPAAVDLLARATGADWLLSFIISSPEASTHQLRGELRKIDEGLWSSPVSPSPIHGRATQSYAVSETISARKSPLSGLRKLHELKEQIVALQTCDIVSESAGHELVTLSNQKLAIFGTDSDFLSRLTDIELSKFAAAPFPSRFPQGHISCSDDQGTITVAHSGLEKALHFKLEAQETLKLRHIGQSENLNMHSHNGETLEATFAPGRPWWNKLSRKESSSSISTPIIEFTSITSSKLNQTFVLSNDYKVFVLAPNLQLVATPLSSGIGFSAYAHGAEKTLFVTTSSITRQPSDLVRIQNIQGEILRRIKVPLPVRASVTAPGYSQQSTRVFLAGPQGRDDMSSIYYVEVSNK